jgi:outer membrane protein assembly factor BamB
MNNSARRTGRFSIAALTLVVGLVAAGCGSVANPRGWAAPVVRDQEQVVYVSSDAGKLAAYRLDGGTGRVWEFPGGDSDLKLQGIYGTPASEGDVIYLSGYGGSVAAVAAADGTERWSRQAGDRVIGGTLVTADTLYAGTDAGELVAFDRASGAERWRRQAGNQIWSTPVLVGDLIVIAGMDGYVTAYRPDGAEAWRTQVAGHAIAGTPALVDGVLYLSSFDRHVYAVDARSGEVRWRSAGADNWFWTEPLVDGDTLYAGSLDSHVYAFDRQTGELRWRTAVGAPVRARGALVDGVLVMPVSNGNLWGLRPQTGEQAWVPQVVGGTLYADLTAARSGLYLATEVGKKSHRLYVVDAATGNVREIPLVK